MKDPFFKKSVIISLVGHFTVFSIFSISFGNKLPYLGQLRVNSVGAILSAHDIIKQMTAGKMPNRILEKYHADPFIKANTTFLNNDKGFVIFLPHRYDKPHVDFSFNNDKLVPAPPVAINPRNIRKKPVIMLYPSLPYYFTIYFQDRQNVHIELLFSIIPSGSSSFVVIKRKISSGNLEADLLSMRYMSTYLFIQQKKFSLRKWETVKIDLSAKK